MKTKTALEAYKAAQMAVKEKGEALARACAAHVEKAIGDPLNWEYVGDMAHLAELLDECLAAVKS